jgi:hypothetical protein
MRDAMGEGPPRLSRSTVRIRYDERVASVLSGCALEGVAREWQPEIALTGRTGKETRT